MYPVPTTLSPSRIDSFLKCPLAFRFSSIEGLREPPSAPATKGSLVHRALELLLTLPAAERTRAAGEACFLQAAAEYRSEADFTGLQLSEAEADEFFADARQLAEGYFDIENPADVQPVGLELRVEAPVGEVLLRGIIDRLERDAEGRYVITDYKASTAPPPAYQAERFHQLQSYAYMVEHVYGERPATLRLMYLRSGTVISSDATAPSLRAAANRTTAVHQAVTAACTSGNFVAKRSNLCSYCFFKDWCPEFGGNPDAAHAEAPVRLAERAG